jgi:hypothetical protein
MSVSVDKTGGLGKNNLGVCTQTASPFLNQRDQIKINKEPDGPQTASSDITCGLIAAFRINLSGCRKKA